MSLILASQSPRRKELLGWLKIPFEVMPSDFDEDQVEEEDPIELATELAIQKALVVSRKVPDALILGADTVVEVNGELLGKASDEVDTINMIRKLSGTRHRVVTGVALVNSLTGERDVTFDVSHVTFRNTSEKELLEYSKLDTWKGKAGAYAIQEDPHKFVSNAEGSFTNIIGLPLLKVAQLLTESGIVVPVDPEKIIFQNTGHRS